MATFSYVFNLTVATIFGLLNVWVFDLSGKEAIVLIGLLFIAYNQHCIMKEIDK